MSPHAFQEQYLTLATRLYGVAFAILGNAQDAEDAVQDAYIRLWKCIDRLDDVRSSEAFFVTTVRNVCLNSLRGRSRETDFEGIDDVADTPARDPADETESHSFWQRALGHLAPKARRIVTLRHIGEYSTHDIADITGETETNVRSTLSRARRQLREEYQRELAQER